MRTFMMRTKFWWSGALAVFAICTGASGDYSTAANNIKSQLGTQTAQDATATCDIATMSGNNGGNLGIVNQFFCLANTFGLTGATGAAGITNTFSIGSSTLKGHVVITEGVTVGSTTYDWEAKVWVCNVTAGSTCDQVSQFIPIMYVVWTMTDDKSVNKGILAHNFGISSGNTVLGSLKITWDTGTASASQTFTLDMVDGSSPPAQAGNVVYTRTASASTLTKVQGTNGASGNRAALAWNFSTGAGAWYEDTSAAAASDTPVAAGCFTRVAAAPDYTYSSASCSGAPAMPTFQSATINSMVTEAGLTIDATTGVTAVTTIAGTAMNGMTSHPASL